MFTEKLFKIICVTGAHSMVGKTTLCSILLKELKGFGAIKFTKTHQTIDRRLQTTDNKTPDSELQTPNSKLRTLDSLLVDDINILNQRGKDTAIFLESGAERVLWIQSPYNGLKDILKIAISRMKGLKGVIIEGNSPVDFINPSLIIFIISAEGKIKSSARKVSKKADVVIINSGERVKKLPFLSMIGQRGRKIFWIDLRKREGEIDKFLRFVKKRIDEAPN